MPRDAPPREEACLVGDLEGLLGVLLDDEQRDARRGEPCTVRAVLDWELWTLGDVLADVGFLLNNWYEPGDQVPLVWMEVPPTSAGGFASRAEVLDRYAARTSFDLADIEYYRAFQPPPLGDRVITVTVL